jgi:hypothetical protein
VDEALAVEPTSDEVVDIPALVLPPPPQEEARPSPAPPRPARSHYLVLERISARGYALDDGRLREHWEAGEQAEFHTLVADSVPHALRPL